MAYQGKGPAVDITIEAGADLSAAQHKFVKLSSGQVVVCDGLTDIPLGVLQNAPDAQGKPAIVRLSGVSKVSADADLTQGALIGTSADGQAAAKTPGSDTTNYVCGVLLDDPGAAGELCSVLLSGVPVRAA